MLYCNVKWWSSSVNKTHTMQLLYEGVIKRCKSKRNKVKWTFLYSTRMMIIGSHSSFNVGEFIGLLCLTSHSTIFQLYCGVGNRSTSSDIIETRAVQKIHSFCNHSYLYFYLVVILTYNRIIFYEILFKEFFLIFHGIIY
jgi:hypothetical protein